MRRRVAITGLGVVSPVGNDVATFWQSLLAGESGVGFITEFPTDKLRSDICAAVKGFEPGRYLSPKETDIYGRVTQLSLAAAVEAMTQAGLAGLYRDDDEVPQPEIPGIDRGLIGCLISTGQGSVDVFEEQIAKSNARGPRAVSPYFIPAVMPNSGTALVSMRYGLMGPSYNIASACATGTHSIATSAMMIEAGEAEMMVAGGAEAATRLNTVAGFGNARALARALDGDPKKASRPFDKRRQGFVMGEGAGALVLEAEEHAKARGAKILAYVAGWGMTSDGEHITRPHPEGMGLARAMERALKRAGVAPAEVGYINPHATSTQQGDVAEFLALRRVFGERLPSIPMSATKSMIGHLLGGAGGAESIATVCSLVDQTIHPSINVDELDPVFTIDLVRERRRADVRYAIKASAGFGGHNCALVFERA
ncbi:3-oxoacyl-[acyl-carrier-protein] synthase, KASII [Minicystis rosea]|nr:3-oxoacyl-[acyl-carrier-protein] synthase, KASII [Minicystis rosea]